MGVIGRKTFDGSGGEDNAHGTKSSNNISKDERKSRSKVGGGGGGRARSRIIVREEPQWKR